jgi:hypothetical protein
MRAVTEAVNKELEKTAIELLDAMGIKGGFASIRPSSHPALKIPLYQNIPTYARRWQRVEAMIRLSGGKTNLAIASKMVRCYDTGDRTHIFKAPDLMSSMKKIKVLYPKFKTLMRLRDICQKAGEVT